MWYLKRYQMKLYIIPLPKYSLLHYWVAAEFILRTSEHLSWNILANLSKQHNNYWRWLMRVISGRLSTGQNCIQLYPRRYSHLIITPAILWLLYYTSSTWGPNVTCYFGLSTRRTGKKLLGRSSEDERAWVVKLLFNYLFLLL